ncbi:N/A [soil metagenome]
MQEFTGKNAVVTGAAAGIGLAIARALAAEGANVVVADLHADAAEAVAAELRERGVRSIGVGVDVSKLEDMQLLAATARAELGDIHVLVNNAGIDGYRGGAIWQADDADWAWSMGVNFDGVVNGLRAFVDDMITHGQPAHIVNTGSESGLWKATSMYGLTKHAVVALTEVLETQLSARGANIGVSVLCPGPVATEFFESKHRPVALEADTSSGKADRERLQQHIDASGISPDAVAQTLLDGIRANRLYLLTPNVTIDEVRKRAATIVGS